MTFEDFFASATRSQQDPAGPTGFPPHAWQLELAAEAECRNRLIRIPTGFGKTLGVLAVWAWHRLHHGDDAWPRRLVWCLPMRVLVEQTVDAAKLALARLGLLTENDTGASVFPLMGGADPGDWHLYPERCAVLIGTQDMLLSRALNRGYASPRARWPMEFGLLNQDCLWVFDEIQLMDVALATSGQLQAFRDTENAAGKQTRPVFSWWMSATLQADWFKRSPETAAYADMLPHGLTDADRSVSLWTEVEKPCSVIESSSTADTATLIARLHLEHGRGAKGPTLVVVNTVEEAVTIYRQLSRDKSLEGTDLRLIHSRFRPAERAGWRSDFLHAAACAPGKDRIVVATQVVEAGVDYSAALLVTQLAPWASLVQRFGRSARWGGRASVVVVDYRPKDDKAALPYALAELDAARAALAELAGASPAGLAAFEAAHPEMLAPLYPYEPRHLLLRHEVDDLFDTTPDLSGADIDISRYIRSGPERDVQVFWEDIRSDEHPSSKLRPQRDALCAVPFLKSRDWLCEKGSDRLKAGMRAWVWDWLENTWRRAGGKDLYPGQTVLVAAENGGYLASEGWAPQSSIAVLPLPTAEMSRAEEADSTQDDEAMSRYPWKTIATHGAETGQLAIAIAKLLVPEQAELFGLAGRWHDAGKAFVAFQGSMCAADRPQRGDLAKAPPAAWLAPPRMYPMPDEPRRAGFRHELASTLALFSVLQKYQPEHAALLGPWRELLGKIGHAVAAAPEAPVYADTGVLEAEVLALGADAFDLLAYLVCAHHGKVRVTWHACKADQDMSDGRTRIRGIVEGDMLHAMQLADSTGTARTLPELKLSLAASAAGLNPHTGRGWTERVLGLLERHGPFGLAYLECLLRAADQRASALTNADPLLDAETPGEQSTASADVALED
ncbi:MAG: DEAD/DEAH box helicase [Rhodocyclaceae bacterium]|nr:DEAD/DEAH box helicase [Rhodocyclaceae bacterium]